jgi:hypothetical protein
MANRKMPRLIVLTFTNVCAPKAYCNAISEEAVYANAAQINTPDSSLIPGGLTDEEGNFSD